MNATIACSEQEYWRTVASLTDTVADIAKQTELPAEKRRELIVRSAKLIGLIDIVDDAVRTSTKQKTE